MRATTLSPRVMILLEHPTTIFTSSTDLFHIVTVEANEKHVFTTKFSITSNRNLGREKISKRVSKGLSPRFGTNGDVASWKREVSGRREKRGFSRGKRVFCREPEQPQGDQGEATRRHQLTMLFKRSARRRKCAGS